MNGTKSREVETVARAIFCQYNGPLVEVTVEDNCLTVRAPVSFHAERKGQHPFSVRIEKRLKIYCDALLTKNIFVLGWLKLMWIWN